MGKQLTCEKCGEVIDSDKEKVHKIFCMLGLTVNTIEAFEHDLIFRMFSLADPNLI